MEYQYGQLWTRGRAGDEREGGGRVCRWAAGSQAEKRAAVFYVELAQNMNIICLDTRALLSQGRTQPVSGSSMLEPHIRHADIRISRWLEEATYDY